MAHAAWMQMGLNHAFRPRKRATRVPQARDCLQAFLTCIQLSQAMCENEELMPRCKLSVQSG
eukprot:1158173-Pelagomonas_calceolata.AAC.1